MALVLLPTKLNKQKHEIVLCYSGIASINCMQ